MQKLILYLVICAMSLSSCSKNQTREIAFKEESFEKEIKPLNGKVISNPDLLFGEPSWIRFHPDSFLLIIDRSGPKQLKIIDLKNDEVQEMIPQGRGPGEMITAYHIEILDNNVYVLCAQTSKVIKITPDINRKFVLTDELILGEKYILHFYPAKEDLIICPSNPDSDKRLTFFDQKGGLLKKTGDYPPFKMIGKVIGANDALSSWIAGSSEAGRIVLACNYADIIEIFDFSGALKRRIHGPLGITLTVSVSDLGYGTTVNRDPSYLMYAKLDASKDEFWAGYTGLKLKKGTRPSVFETFPKKIFCFKWNGDPIRKISLSSSFIDFDFDWKNKVLYTIEWHGETLEPVYYNLKQYFR